MTRRFTPGTETDVSFTLTTKDATRYIPIGSQFSFHWVLTDNDGQVLQTPDETQVFLDGRYQWQHRTVGQVTVYWYGSTTRTRRSRSTPQRGRSRTPRSCSTRPCRTRSA